MPTVLPGVCSFSLKDQETQLVQQQMCSWWCSAPGLTGLLSVTFVTPFLVLLDHQKAVPRTNFLGPGTNHQCLPSTYYLPVLYMD